MSIHRLTNGAVAALLGMAGLAGQADASACDRFRFGDEVVLSGKVVTKIYPGPPNYQNVSAGDAAETVRILKLKKPVCVDTNSQQPEDQPALHVRVVQLVFDADVSRPGRSEVSSKNVSVTGSLFHAQTGHHHTAVLLSVRAIRLTP